MEHHLTRTPTLHCSGDATRGDAPRDTESGPLGESRPRAGGLPGGTGERILLVDDEDTVRRVTERLLQKLGYAVTATQGAETALEILETTEDPFDLVLTDVVMPGMTGIEMGEEIRRRYPDQRILFTSGYTTREYGREPGQPPQPFMPKPFSMADLARTVRRVLETD